MTDVYVIRNQLGHYWGKKKLWVGGADARIVMRLKHNDEAVNTLFELGSKDIHLRGEIVSAKLSARGEPMIELSEIPLPEMPEDEHSADDEQATQSPQIAEA